MAKSDCNLNELSVENAYKRQNNAKWSERKAINAFDTETTDGNVFMLSFSFHCGLESVIDDHTLSGLDSKRIFRYLTHNECRSAINVWYNLDFDANAILSGVLNKKQLCELSITCETEVTINNVEYQIRYVKGKFLSIQDEHRNTYDHFDIGQFFYTSLDEACDEWLNKNKIDEVDTRKFGSNICDKHTEAFEDCENCWSTRQAHNYILEHYKTIKKYAEKDAILTRELGNELIREAEQLDIPMGRPFSTGYMSAEYQRANMDAKPKFGKREYQSMFWDSYYGGRFEVFQRGNVGEVVAPDINSAYPAVMMNLPDPTTLDWIHYCNEPIYNDYRKEPNNFNYDTLKNGDYGVVRVTVTTNENAAIQPFAYKMNGKVKYPVLEDTEITVLKPIFEFAVKQNLVTDYELHECWIAHETDRTTYPFTWIGEQYADRKEYAKKELKRKEQLVKIVLNSGYGKTCQTTEQKRIHHLPENEAYELDEKEKVYPSIFLSKEQREKLGENEVIISSQKCGRRFNPFFASYITGLTRLKLHQSVIEYDIAEDTYMFATDCIMVDKDAYEQSDFSELIQTPNFDLEDKDFRQSAIASLGKWDFDYEGQGFIVGSGVYEVEKPNSDRKTKTRGFTEKSLETSLKELARKNPEGIPIKNDRPLTIPEVLINPDRGNASEFVDDSKTLNPDFDDKRNWEIDELTFNDLLNNHENSEPLILTDELVNRYTPNETKLTKAEQSLAEIMQ